MGEKLIYFLPVFGLCGSKINGFLSKAKLGYLVYISLGAKLYSLVSYLPRLSRAGRGPVKQADGSSPGIKELLTELRNRSQPF